MEPWKDSCCSSGEASAEVGDQDRRRSTCHRQPKLILRNLQNVGHYKTLYWEFAHFLKIVEYCYYCGNKVYLPSAHLVLVCCAQSFKVLITLTTILSSHLNRYCWGPPIFMKSSKFVCRAAIVLLVVSFMHKLSMEIRQPTECGRMPITVRWEKLKRSN